MTLSDHGLELNRRCIFVQVSKADPLKRSIDKQLKDAISGVAGF